MSRKRRKRGPLSRAEEVTPGPGRAPGSERANRRRDAIAGALAVRVSRRGKVRADQGTAGKVTWETVIAGLGLGALGLTFIVSILLQHPMEAARSGVVPDAWVRRRVDRQQKAMFALMLLLLVVPWSFLFLGERGMIVTLFVLKAGLDAWTVAPTDETV